MDLTKKIFAVLKPKAEAFGFNRKELQGVAADIANNLTLDEDASDEDIDAAVETAVNAVIPMLKIGQTMANRVINKAKDDLSKKTGEGTEVEDDDEGTPTSKSKTTKTDDTTPPAWVVDFKKHLEEIEGQVAALKGEKKSESRKGRLKELLKDTGTFGSRTLKNFDKMSFESDDDFEDYLSEVEDDLKALNQERADAGLSHLGTPPVVPPVGGAGQAKEVLTDEELEQMVKSY